jgi:hypothetical protein
MNNTYNDYAANKLQPNPSELQFPVSAAKSWFAYFVYTLQGQKCKLCLQVLSYKNGNDNHRDVLSLFRAYPDLTVNGREPKMLPGGLAHRRFPGNFAFTRGSPKRRWHIKLFCCVLVMALLHITLSVAAADTFRFESPARVTIGDDAILTLQSAGIQADMHLCMKLPDNSLLFVRRDGSLSPQDEYMRRLSPVLSGVTLNDTEVTMPLGVIPPTAPAGIYRLYATLTAPGAAPAATSNLAPVDDAMGFEIVAP